MSRFQFEITTGSEIPIYRQIVDQVRLAAATGVLAPGDALPSVRALAEQLLINANTVAKAYGELAQEGVVESRQSLGFFIAPRRQIYSKSERLRRLRAAAGTFVRECVYLDFPAEQIIRAVDEQLNALEWGVKSGKGGD
jgi:GntR family transcriptional regulator